VESVTAQYLKECTYHKVTDSLCPMFELGYVVKESGQNFSMLAVKVRKILLLTLQPWGGDTRASVTGTRDVLSPGLHRRARIKSLMDDETLWM